MAWSNLLSLACVCVLLSCMCLCGAAASEEGPSTEPCPERVVKGLIVEIAPQIVLLSFTSSICSPALSSEWGCGKVDVNVKLGEIN